MVCQGVIASPLSAGRPQHIGTINSSCFCINPWLRMIYSEGSQAAKAHQSLTEAFSQLRLRPLLSQVDLKLVSTQILSQVVGMFIRC